MNPNLLTDPTSLIAYRLVHGETSRGKSPTREARSNGTRFALVAILGLGLLFAVVLMLGHV